MSEITLLLHNIRSCHNVGSILRTADGFGVKTAIFSGYTPRYDDSTLLPHLREKLNHQIEKTALGAEKYLNLEVSEDIVALLDKLRSENCAIIGLENNLVDPRKITLSVDHLSQIRSALRSYPRIAILLGEEVAGIDPALYPHLDHFLEIPMHGHKESFNVGIATGIALFCLSDLEN